MNEPHLRPFAAVPALAARAAELLVMRTALPPLTADEARRIVAYMRLNEFPAGAVLFNEGERSGTNYMLLLLEGRVAVGLIGGPDAEEVPISELGAGNIIGEMALLDDEPRSAQCTALSPVIAAGLSRRELERLFDEHPRLAAKLLAGLAQRLGDRVRALSLQMQVYASRAAAAGLRPT